MGCNICLGFILLVLYRVVSHRLTYSFVHRTCVPASVKPSGDAKENPMHFPPDSICAIDRVPKLPPVKQPPMEKGEGFLADAFDIESTKTFHQMDDNCEVRSICDAKESTESSLASSTEIDVDKDKDQDKCGGLEAEEALKFIQSGSESIDVVAAWSIDDFTTAGATAKVECATKATLTNRSSSTVEAALKGPGCHIFASIDEKSTDKTEKSGEFMDRKYEDAKETKEMDAWMEESDQLNTQRPVFRLGNECSCRMYVMPFLRRALCPLVEEQISRLRLYMLAVLALLF